MPMPEYLTLLKQKLQEKLGSGENGQAILTDKGFVSTSYDPANHFVPRGEDAVGIEYVIKVNRGTSGMNVHGAESHAEREILLNAGTKFRLLKICYNGAEGEPHRSTSNELMHPELAGTDKNVWKVYLETIPTNEGGVPREGGPADSQGGNV